MTLSKSLPIALALILLLTSCGVRVKADISAYGDTEITISGLLEEDFTVTPNELAQLDCVSRSATGTSAKAGTVSVVGPLLTTFLEQYGKAPSDFSKIRFIASDGYEVYLQNDYLTDYEIILGVSRTKEPLPESEWPLRILIPEAAQGKWEYAVVRIEFEE